jgi:aryl-alcohol dehydrogenase-like predicted oxidoreductase
MGAARLRQPGEHHRRLARPPYADHDTGQQWPRGWRRATPAQVALAWVLAQGRSVIPIPGTKTPKYLAENAGAADVEVSAAALAKLDALPAPEGARY